MKWADLGELIQKMSPQELNKEVVIVAKNDPYLATNLLVNKNMFYCEGFQDGDPYLEAEGKALKDIWPPEDNEFTEGQTVHIDTDSEEWGVRVCGDGTIVEVRTKDCLVDIPGFEGGTRLIVPMIDITIKE